MYVLIRTRIGIRTMRIFFHLDVWLKLAILTLVCCRPSLAQDAVTKFDESEIKAAIEESAVLDVCPDRDLLKFAQIEVDKCRSYISKFTHLCWNSIDNIISDYEIEQNEMGKKRFISILSVYASCIRAEILGQIVESNKESCTP